MRLENGDEKEEGDRDGVVVGGREREIQRDRETKQTLRHGTCLIKLTLSSCS